MPAPVADALRCYLARYRQERSGSAEPLPAQLLGSALGEIVDTIGGYLRADGSRVERARRSPRRWRVTPTGSSSSRPACSTAAPPPSAGRPTAPCAAGTCAGGADPLVVSGGDDDALRLWDLRSGRPIGAPLTGHDGPVTALAIADGGDRVVRGSRDATVRLWTCAAPARGMECARSSAGSTDRCSTGLATPQDREIVVSVSQDGALQLGPARGRADRRRPARARRSRRHCRDGTARRRADRRHGIDRPHARRLGPRPRASDRQPARMSCARGRRRRGRRAGGPDELCALQGHGVACAALVVVERDAGDHRPPTKACWALCDVTGRRSAAIDLDYTLTALAVTPSEIAVAGADRGLVAVVPRATARWADDPVTGAISGLSSHVGTLGCTTREVLIMQSHVKPVSKSAYITSVVVLACGILGLTAAVDTDRVQSSSGELPPELLWLLVLVVISASVSLTLLYKGWAAIQDGHARTTAGKAVGLLFVPFFNRCWVFQALRGLAIYYNAFAERNDIGSPRLPVGLFTASPLLNFATYLTFASPVLGIVLAAAPARRPATRRADRGVSAPSGIRDNGHRSRRCP